MMTILVANTKGGCGKTTIATQLGAALARGGQRVAIADADKQRSSLFWLDRRAAELPAIEALDWSKSEGRPARGTETLIIDAAAALRAKDIEALVQEAEIVVLPLLPSAFDEGATERFIERLEELRPIAKRKKPVAVVGNRLRVGTRAAERLEAFFGGLGHPVVGRLRDSQFYVEAATHGYGVFDRASQRALDLQSDWRPLLDFIADAAE
jgi:chromosome partitioning protein